MALSDEVEAIYSANNSNSLAASFYLANSTALEDTYSGIFALSLYAQEGDVRFSQLTYKPNGLIHTNKSHLHRSKWDLYLYLFI